MKKVITVIYLSLVMVTQGQDWYAKWDQSGATWQEKWKNTLDSIGNYPSSEQIEILGAAVRAGPRIDSPEHLEIFKRSQSVLMEISGHAQFFIDVLEEERANLPPGAWRGNYDSNRYRYIKDTLEHIPSPETIKVLGALLYDDRDVPPPIVPGQDWVSSPRNSLIASETLKSIGLRDPPATIQETLWSNESLAKQRAWYEKIKAGILAFSFLGQKVEYRFKSDGTWEAIALVNAPDDAPKTAKTPPPASPASTKVGQSHGISWGWITAVVLILLVAVAWLRLKGYQHSA